MRSVFINCRMLVVGCAVAAALVIRSPRASGYANTESVENETGEVQNEMQVELEGDQTSDIEGYINPFGPSGEESASYDSSDDETTVEFDAGPDGTPVQPGAEAEEGIIDDHAGMVFDGKGWVTQEQFNQMVNPSLEGTDTGTGPDTEWEVLRGSYQNSGDTLSSDEYTELEVTEGQDMQVEVENQDAGLDGPIFQFNPGYFLSPTEIPLDQLNSTDLPDSMFMPIPGFTNGERINEGSTIDSSDIDVPEPGSLMLAGVGAMILARRRRGRAK
jgi:hypothetical protein